MADERRDVGGLDVSGLVMRVRRTCDLSQRDLGDAIGLDHSQIARIEASLRRVDLPLLARILSLAGMRIAILDRDGNEVMPIAPDVLRDNAGRRMPAHLDVRAPDDGRTSTLLNARYDRTSPKAWYHHQTVRDRRRNAGDSHAIPDQPTTSGVAQRERERHADRLQHARHRAVTLLEVDCTCLGGCWEGRGCVDECECRCEP
jgi:transcriptional regulator with XRE-family HTH domain